MLTRGQFVGQIIDDLAIISAQAKQRGNLHLYDINIYVEDFVKNVLNYVLDFNLSNLNQERLNNPGLDLGDAKKSWAFQVTTDKTSNKIKQTLEKITDDQKKKFRNIRIFIVGEKQKSYTFSDQIFIDNKFTLDMVWDFNDVCTRLMSLDIDTLQQIAKYIAKETRRMLVELEIPDLEGNYPTNIDDLIEKIPKPQLSNAVKMNTYFMQKREPFDCVKAELTIAELSKKLANLPRLTREVFKLMVERRDSVNTETDDFRISDPKLRRIYKGNDLSGDLSLLVEAEIIDFNSPDITGMPNYWSIRFPGSQESFHLNFIDYVEANRIDLRQPLVMLNFSDF
ncbi:SMEK domain-containing protein [Acetobacter pasteurianus]|uniref:SMEK domain-containing protein n=1 Tax=Acetobacter pasteurianus NBRC 3188 TaxID=1226663 RepID=A0A401WTG1_ACEPA|nr:SMEK domain-containing protein [Acetobacter pasteurianus]GCD52597.1 hypothetical protein NBRC3188_1294 [Acetobacter pasteurianus NBRC 3188]